MPHRLHRNVASLIQSSLGRLSEHLAHQELPSARRPPRREVPDFLPSRSHAFLPRERAQEAYSLDRDRRQTKISLNLAIPLRKRAFGFECCQRSRVALTQSWTHDMTFQIEPRHDLSPNELDAIEVRLYEHNIR